MEGRIRKIPSLALWCSRLNSQVRAILKPGARSCIQIFLVDGRKPTTWTILHYSPRCVSKKLLQKWSIQSSNLLAQINCLFPVSLFQSYLALYYKYKYTHVCMYILLPRLNITQEPHFSLTLVNISEFLYSEYLIIMSSDWNWI